MPRCVRQRSGWGARGERGREGHTKTRRHEGGGEGREKRKRGKGKRGGSVWWGRRRCADGVKALNGGG